MIHFIRSLTADQYLWFMVVLGFVTLIMVVREVLKIAQMPGMVAKYGALRFRLGYWIHLGATAVLSIALIVAANVR